MCANRSGSLVLVRAAPPDAAQIGSHASSAWSRSVRPRALMPPSIIETLPSPFDLLADEDSLASEMLQCLCGSRHILAAQAGAVRRRKVGSHPLWSEDRQTRGVFGQLASDRLFIP